MASLIAQCTFKVVNGSQNSATETCVIGLENSSKKTDAECLHQKVSHILNRHLNINIPGNLSKPQK